MKMTAVLSARGPDGEGTYANDDIGVAFGHRRLAVIDVSKSAGQPMSFGNRRYWVVFNGEIYNFSELREELRNEGVAFQTSSDTEVLLAAYAQWGDNFLDRLTGMFAFALLDSGTGEEPPRVLLARDRLGIKPLFCYEKTGVFAFASELRSLRATGLLPNIMQLESLFDYLTMGSVQQPRGGMDGVWAAPPGSAVELRRDPGGRWIRRQWQFWDILSSTENLRKELFSISREDAVLEVGRLLEEATRYHLVADVPVGSFLSGGIDSAGVTGVMSRVSGRPVQTFSVGYRLGGQAGGELDAARLTAARLGTLHHEMVADESTVATSFHPWVRTLDLPSVDGLNTWLVSRFARTNVTVALSGLGGDEFFAGYPHFGYEKAPTWTRGMAGAATIKALGWLHNWAPNRYSLEALQCISNVPDRLRRLRRPIPLSRIRSALAQPIRDKVKDWLKENTEFEGSAVLDIVQETTCAETRAYLVSTLLRDADVASMSHGLEVRPVLLHHPLVEFAFSLPARLKLSGGDGKWVLKRAIEKICPLDFSGQRKRGFELPLSHWATGPLRGETEVALGSRPARALLNDGYRKGLLRDLRCGKVSFEYWAWLVLFSWANAEQLEIPAE